MKTTCFFPLVTMLVFLNFMVPTLQAGISVLVVKDTPETGRYYHYERISSFFYTYDHWFSPSKILSDNFTVTDIGWDRFLEFKSLSDLEKYDLVILWDLPGKMTDLRRVGLHVQGCVASAPPTPEQLALNPPWNYSIGYRDTTYLDDARCAAIRRFVERGGGLLVAGGAMNYGDAPAAFAEAEVSRLKKYHGYHGLPICDILPVEIPNGTTLTTYKNTNDAMAATGKGFLVGLNFSEQTNAAFHKVAAKANAEVLLSTDKGSPLVVISKFGKGRVGCVMLCPKANLLETPVTDPIWPGEAALWERLARWATGSDRPANIQREEKLKKHYEELASPGEHIPVEWLRQQFPFLVTPLYEATPCMNPKILSLFYKYLREFHFTAISPQYHNHPPWLWQVIQENNLLFIPELMYGNMKIWGKKEGVPIEEWAMIAQDGAVALGAFGELATPYSPVSKTFFLNKLQSDMNLLGPPNPYLMGAFLNCEEWALWMQFQGGHGIACFNKYTSEYYKNKTGKEPPKVEWRAPGVIPEDDPLLVWIDTIRMRPFAHIFKAQAELFKKKYPDTVLTFYPGPYEGGLDIITEEIYHHMWREGDLKIFNRIDVRYAFVDDMQGKHTKLLPTIGMLIVPENKSIWPEVLRLNVGMCLGRGANAGVHLWHASNIWLPHFQFAGHERLECEVFRIGDYLHKYGAIYAHLTRPDMPVWCYTGEMFPNAADHFDLLLLPPGVKETPERFWRQMQVEAIAAPALYRAQVPAQGVTEVQLMSKDLFRKKAVFLPGVAYMREAVYKNLLEFIKQGGLVFTDKSTLVKIPGAIQLPCSLDAWHKAVNEGKRADIATEQSYYDQWNLRERMTDEVLPIVEEYIAKKIPAEFSGNSKDCVTSLMLNGDAKYLFVYNISRTQPGSYVVRIRNEYPAIYDINAGKRVRARKAGEAWELPVSLDAGGWKVFLLAGGKISSLAVRNLKLEGNVLRAEVEVLGEDGNLFKAALPLEISLKYRGGKNRTVYRATNEGRFALNLPAMPEPEKLDAVIVKELVSGLNRQVRPAR